jgi:hypothetical protein
MLPEGVGFYATEGKMRMHVSINPFGFDYWYRHASAMSGWLAGRSPVIDIYKPRRVPPPMNKNLCLPVSGYLAE